MRTDELIEVLREGVEVLDRVPSSLERVGLRHALELAAERLQYEGERADRAEATLARIDELAAEAIPEVGTPPASCPPEHLARVAEVAASASREFEFPHRAIVAIWYLARVGASRVEVEPTDALDACARCGRSIVASELRRVGAERICRDLVGCMRVVGCDCDPRELDASEAARVGVDPGYVEHEDDCSWAAGAQGRDGEDLTCSGCGANLVTEAHDPLCLGCDS